MELNYGAHLAYCTNVHRGQTWRQTHESLQKYALAVRRRIRPDGPFAIGLRLSHRAATELAEKKALRDFGHWLDKNECYVFTINGFPYGRFHGAPVKEKVYLPDWTSPDRLAYTNLLFNLLAELLPDGVEGSVSTLPGAFKAFVTTAEHTKAIRENLWRCVEQVSRLSERTGKKLHLGLEPEPLCFLENSAETISFFAQMRAEHKNDGRLDEFLGVTYDCCHFAIEYEEAADALAAFQRAGVKISKIHLSSALRTPATREAAAALKFFSDDVYLHQVVERGAGGRLKFFRDLPEALAEKAKGPSSVAVRVLRGSATEGRLRRVDKTQNAKLPEWRIHFHVPLHAPAVPPFQNTNGHLLDVLDWLAQNPKLCRHLEMETYTWEVLPPELKSRSVVEQLAAEYNWTLAQLAKRGFR